MQRYQGYQGSLCIAFRTLGFPLGGGAVVAESGDADADADAAVEALPTMGGNVGGEGFPLKRCHWNI